MGIRTTFQVKVHHSEPRSIKQTKQQQQPQQQLPSDVQELKQLILQAHPAKLIRFSLSHMKHVATPPVDIPKKLAGRRALNTVVSGKKVPLTKQMWENCKKKAKYLDMIDEYVRY